MDIFPHKVVYKLNLQQTFPLTAKAKRKMTLDVAVMASTEMIKPSSPTPPNLKTFKLSVVDQYSPPIGVPIILFYSAAQGDHNISHRLKKSFADTLNDFYPLAGKVVDNLYIDCDDNGVKYLEANIRSRLDRVLKCPQADELNQLLPHYNGMSSSETLLQIQINTFDCGGVAVAARISHKVADGASLYSFMNAWAAKTRGSSSNSSAAVLQSPPPPPQFDSAALFPAIPEGVAEFKPPPPGPGGITQRVVTRWFVFDSSDIAALKAKCASKSYPTRVEIVSALIWKCLMNANSSTTKSFLVSLAVNFRSRMVPPLPDHSFGNLIIGALPSPSERGAELHGLVERLREAIKKIDGDYVKCLQDGDGLSRFHQVMRQSTRQLATGELGLYIVSSWCRFAFYEADFGWGNPTWATPLNVAHKNVVFLMDQKHGDGIEAMVTLEEEEMAIFESDQQLLDFATPVNMAT